MEMPTEPAAKVLRRFVLLGGVQYYAHGGFYDFISSHESLDEAVARAVALEGERPDESSIEWWHVWDCEKSGVVARSKWQAYGQDTDWPKLD
jgi:hypothetical protein